MPAVTPYLIQKTPDILQFYGVISEECFIDIQLSVNPTMHPPVDVVLEFEIVPPSHFMFSNNRTRFNVQCLGVTHNYRVRRAFKIKKRVVFEGRPNLILNVNVLTMDGELLGRCTTNAWQYI
ncbi:MAG: hypothetical protein IPP61_13115 [Cytophagaceae bacterium]|nr:hypothetical protein [Cytophagaceae bacterium]MBK9933036.1 hypothetical protein [Cytophagaceae bacterium]MBL0303247.1 hypothetical protein [Cytophagaceae bacterium]MBL0326099.1 hypothetical protein [Cytophagaceae bacterium]